MTESVIVVVVSSDRGPPGSWHLSLDGTAARFKNGESPRLVGLDRGFATVLTVRYSSCPVPISELHHLTIFLPDQESSADSLLVFSLTRSDVQTSSPDINKFPSRFEGIRQMVFKAEDIGSMPRYVAPRNGNESPHGLFLLFDNIICTSVMVLQRCNIGMFPVALCKDKDLSRRELNPSIDKLQTPNHAHSNGPLGDFTLQKFVLANRDERMTKGVKLADRGANPQSMVTLVGKCCRTN
ncbi:hypothetical protein CCUS01_13104 [Colletotrichum cuscutae]|uniref:Uncharacterized protein n=1 Tax=Colletotrichum cuscutae TaxID=1209917 RepID=A0AAJ0DPZ3_9PEZI|nr:hypothetical protein CCUS01_13104 [Colletotrichum cuscutae]